MLKQALVASVMTMGVFGGSAYAHGGLEMPVGGDPVQLSEAALNWNAGVGVATVTTGSNKLVAMHFEVLNAGLNTDTFDIYGDDFNDSLNATNTGLFLFKKDAVGHDWTAVATGTAGSGPRVNLQTSTNLFGVPITGYIDQFNAGNPDPGFRMHLDTGVYMALAVSSQGTNDWVYNQGTLTGFKYSEGFSWTIQTGDNTDMFVADAPWKLTVKATLPTSAAVVGPVSEVPVPGAVWLMGSVLAGFGAFGRRKAVITA